MSSYPHDESHTSRRPIAIPYLLLAGLSLLLSTFGQAYVLLTSSFSPQYPRVSAAHLSGIAVAILSAIGGSWLYVMAKPSSAAIQLDMESHSPLLDTFVNDKRPLRININVKTAAPLDTRASQATYLPYFIAGNVCLGASRERLMTSMPLANVPIGAWGLLYSFELYITSQLALLTNLIIQNYAIFISLHSWRHPELRFNKQTWRTHVLSKGNAALAVLFLWTNSGILEVSSAA